jgi:hypothetical protein
MKHAAEVRSDAFAQEFGRLLHGARGRRRLRHYATAPFDIRMLKAAERGRLALDAPMVNALACRYGIDLADVYGPSREVEITDGVVSAGEDVEAFPPGEAEAMYDAYLALVRRLRGVGEGDRIVLRTADVGALADAAGESYVHVLHELGIRMGLDRADRVAMADMLLRGAVVAGVADPG